MHFDYAFLLAQVKAHIPENHLITLSLPVNLQVSMSLDVGGDNTAPSGDALRHSLGFLLPNKASDKSNLGTSLYASTLLHIQGKSALFPG